MTDLSPAGGDIAAADAPTPASGAATPDNAVAANWNRALDPELGALVAAKG